jgi:S1-C subfamily serine protease
MGQLRRVAYLVPAWLLLSLPAMGQDSLPAETVQSLKASTVYVKTAVGPVKMTGSGFVVQIEGDSALIATNQHVVAKPQELQAGGFIPGLRGRGRLSLRGLQMTVAQADPVVTVVFNSGDAEEQTLPAEILATLNDPDLAILKVKGIKTPPKAIEFANVPAPIETTPVFILGFPFGDSLSTNHGNPNITVGKGSISSIRKGPSGKISKVQIDGSLNPGNSGGPVVDINGNLVGIAVQTIQGSNIGLAIAAGELVDMLEGRVGKPLVIPGPIVDGAAPSYEVVVPIVDPLNRIKSVSVEYVDGAVTVDPGKVNQPQLTAMEGTQKADLVVADRVGKATLDLPTTANQAARQVTVQASYVNQQGQTVFLEPQVLQVNAPLVVTTNKGTGSSTIITTQKSGNVTIRREITTTRGGSSPTTSKGGFGFADDEVANGDDDDEPVKKETTPKGESEPKE